MIQDNYQIYSGSGTQLYCVSWQPDKPAKAVLCIVHGLGEHHGRYEEMAIKCVENQIAVFAFDHRGHGKSEGKRGHALSIAQFVEDVEHALMQCRSLFLEAPIFLFGHSMGGQIVASYLEKVKSKEISGAIISSPWIKLVKPLPGWQIALVKKLSPIFPSLTLPNGIDPKYISTVSVEVEKYKDDPLTHSRISMALFNSLHHNGIYLEQSAEESKIPVLVCHSDSDPITSPDASARYAAKLGKNATFKLWKGSLHEPHHDFEKEMVMDYYLGFIKDHAVKGK
jgi:acylglycerol lipase